MRRALLVAAGFVAGLVLCEVGARLVLDEPPFPSSGSTPADIPQRAGRRLPGIYGTYTYDAEGFRTGSGLAHDRTVLFLGDSFTEGHGVEDAHTFARATERALRDRGIAARSLNAGQHGFGAAQELHALRRSLDTQRIDALALQSFPMNDISDNLEYGAFGVEDGRLVEYAGRHQPWRSRLADTIGGTALADSYLIRIALTALLAGAGAAPYEAPDGFALERALLTAIVATARERGIPIVALVIPTKLDQAQPSPDGDFARVRDVLVGLRVPLVDAGAIIPDLATDAAKGDGAHFSVEGNARIGEALAERLAPLLQ